MFFRIDADLKRLHCKLYLRLVDKPSFKALDDKEEKRKEEEEENKKGKWSENLLLLPPSLFSMQSQKNNKKWRWNLGGFKYTLLINPTKTKLVIFMNRRK